MVLNTPLWRSNTLLLVPIFFFFFQMKRRVFGVPGLITRLAISVVSKEDRDFVLTMTKPIVLMEMNMVLRPKKDTVPKTNVLVFSAISTYFNFYSLSLYYILDSSFITSRLSSYQSVSILNYTQANIVLEGQKILLKVIFSVRYQ